MPTTACTSAGADMSKVCAVDAMSRGSADATACRATPWKVLGIVMPTMLAGGTDNPWAAHLRVVHAVEAAVQVGPLGRVKVAKASIEQPLVDP